MENEPVLSMSQLSDQATPATPSAPAEPAAAPDPGAGQAPAAQTGTPAEPASASPAAQQDPVREYNAQLQRENAELRRRNQDILDKQTDLLQKSQDQIGNLLKSQQPAASPEELKRQQDAIWAEISANPDEFVKSRINKSLEGLGLEKTVEAAVKKLLGKELVQLEPVLQQATKQSIYRGLVDVGYAQAADPKFRETMEAEANVGAVLSRFYKNGYEPEKLFKDPLFYERLYNMASETQRAQAPAASGAQTPTAQTKDALRQVAVSQGVTGPTAGKAGQAAPANPTAGMFKTKSLSQLAGEAKWSS